MIDSSKFSIPCTGDVCVGDTILFSESVFEGSYKRPRYIGERTIVAKIFTDSYGAEKQQHTFSLLVIESEGHDPLKAGERIRRKGRNIYRNGTARIPWDADSDLSRPGIPT